MICGGQKEVQQASEFAGLRAHALTRLRVKFSLRVLAFFILGALIAFGISPLASASATTCRMSCCARMATCCCRPSQKDSAAPSRQAWHRPQAVTSCPRTCAGATTATWQRQYVSVGDSADLPDLSFSSRFPRGASPAFKEPLLSLPSTRSPPAAPLTS